MEPRKLSGAPVIYRLASEGGSLALNRDGLGRPLQKELPRRERIVASDDASVSRCIEGELQLGAVVRGRI